jgi:hypothetical protein
LNFPGLDLTPCLLTVITGVGFSLSEEWGVKQKLLLHLHVGHFGPLNLSSVYPTLLGVMTLVIIVSGLQLYWPVRRRSY